CVGRAAPLLLCCCGQYGCAWAGGWVGDRREQRSSPPPLFWIRLHWHCEVELEADAERRSVAARNQHAPRNRAPRAMRATNVATFAQLRDGRPVGPRSGPAVRGSKNSGIRYNFRRWPIAKSLRPRNLRIRWRAIKSEIAVRGRRFTRDLMAQHQSLLEFKHGRYLKAALVLCAVAIGVYWYHEVPATQVKPYGGTWLGYTLGTIAALLIVWLMLLGIRKRRYDSRLGSVQGWASAHVYLGTSLIILATLHCGFEFGWNLHPLAYALMMLVIRSGFFGVSAYLRHPEIITANLAGETLETMLLKVSDLETKCKRIALDLPDEVNALFMNASRLSAERSA